MKVAMLGLGHMGLPMAQNLAKARLLSSVFNRTPAKAEPLTAQGIKVGVTPAQASREADVVLSMVSDDQALEELCFGVDGLIRGLKPGAIHVSMSTISVDLAKRLAAEHHAAKQGFLSAPVFGRPEAAAAKKLFVLCAGHSYSFERVRPALEAVGQQVFYVGDQPWKANLMKLSGNFLITSMMESLSECYALLEKSGVDAKAFYEIITSTLFAAPVYQNYGRLLLERRFDPPGFKLKLGLKDVSLLLRSADNYQVPMPAARQIHAHFLTGMAQGLGEMDWAAIREVVSRESGLR